MGSTKDSTTTTKLSHLYDPSSSPSHSLLSKPYPSPIDYNPSTSDSKPTQISYNSGCRPIRDLHFLILFSLFIISTFAFGIFTSVHKNPNSSRVPSFTYDSYTASCIKPTSISHSIFISSNFYSEKSYLLKVLAWTLVITFVLSAPFALFVRLLLKHYAKQIVYVSLPFFIIVPIFIKIYWFVACTVNSTYTQSFPLVYRILVLLFVFLIIGINLWIFVANWHRIELTMNIIEVAANALSRNLGLFWVLPALNIGLVVYFVPIVVFLVFARLNGKIVLTDLEKKWKKKKGYLT